MAGCGKLQAARRAFVALMKRLAKTYAVKGSSWVESEHAFQVRLGASLGESEHEFVMG